MSPFSWLQTDYIDIGNIGYRMSDGQFTDLNNNIIHHLFKLYPGSGYLLKNLDSILPVAIFI